MADYDEEEENLQPYGYRVLNSQADFETLLQHLYTAFKRMDEVRLDHTVGVPHCLFQLHKEQEWHHMARHTQQLHRSHGPVCNLLLQHLLAVEDLGRGGQWAGGGWPAQSLPNVS